MRKKQPRRGPENIKSEVILGFKCCCNPASALLNMSPLIFCWKQCQPTICTAQSFYFSRQIIWSNYIVYFDTDREERSHLKKKEREKENDEGHYIMSLAVPLLFVFFLSSSGNYFASHFFMGGEKFDTPHPEGYLFGENMDLNFLGNRPVQVRADVSSSQLF